MAETDEKNDANGNVAAPVAPEPPKPAAPPVPTRSRVLDVERPGEGVQSRVYCYVGAYSEIGDRQFSFVGQRADFSDARYKEVALARAAFIPQADFDAAGFTLEEVTRYQNFFGQPTQAWKDKIEVGRQKYRDIVAELQAGTYQYR